MKILIISPYIPYPLDSGGNQAVFAMIDYLRKKQDITLISFVTRETAHNLDELQKLWDDVKFRPYYLTKVEPTVQYLKEHYGGEPDTLAYRWLNKAEQSILRKKRRRYKPADDMRAKSCINYYLGNISAPFMQFIHDEVHKGHYDIVQAEFYDLLPVVYLLPPKQISVFVHHELRFVRNRNEIDLFDNRNCIDELLYEMEKSTELGALERYSHIITLSETDENILRKELRNTHIHTSPAVTFTSSDNKITFSPTHKNLVFVGSGNHYPNDDAMKWFCAEIAPILQRAGTSFTLHIVGQWSDSLQEQLKERLPEVRFTGFVDDLTRFLNGKIMIVPLRIGSGIRMKIMDAVKSKSPFITTTKGVEGLDFCDQKECLIADNATDFAAAITQLLNNPTMQENLQNQATEKLSALYNTQTIYERRNHLYEQFLQESQNKNTPKA